MGCTVKNTIWERNLFIKVGFSARFCCTAESGGKVDRFPVYYFCYGQGIKEESF